MRKILSMFHTAFDKYLSKSFVTLQVNLILWFLELSATLSSFYLIFHHKYNWTGIGNFFSNMYGRSEIKQTFNNGRVHIESGRYIEQWTFCLLSIFVYLSSTRFQMKVLLWGGCITLITLGNKKKSYFECVTWFHSIGDHWCLNDKTWSSVANSA